MRGRATIGALGRVATGLCLVAATAVARPRETELYSVIDDVGPRDGVAVGVTLGTPAMLNLSVAKWGFGDTALLLRFSGGYLSTKMWGVQPEIGWAFDREGALRQYVSLGLSWFHFAPSADPFPRFGGPMAVLDFFGAGPFYGVHWGHWTFELGVPVGSYRGIHSNGVPVDTFRPTIHVQMGYGVLF